VNGGNVNLFCIDICAAKHGTPISVVLTTPEDIHLLGTSHPPHNETVLAMDVTGSGFNVQNIRNRIAQTHDIPACSVSLFRDIRARRETEYLDTDTIPYTPSDPEGLRIYWAFQGDSPSDWRNKIQEITPVIDHVLLSITEQLNNTTFFLEKDFNWPDNMSNDHKRNHWLHINGLPEASSQPALPINVVVDEVHRNGRYETHPEELENAYHKLNLYWRSTADSIFESIRNIRTDKEQYRHNLDRLEENDSLLRKKIKDISGNIFPPFPDSALYTPLFQHSREVQTSENDPRKIAGTPPDLIINSLIGSIEQNTTYYHQELGKYNQLKKEECQLIEKYLQIKTRMKIWIVRERIRLVAWELVYGKAYEDVDEIIKPEDRRVIRETVPYPPTLIPSKKRSFQCIDFCQCQFGCQFPPMPKTIPLPK